MTMQIGLKTTPSSAGNSRQIGESTATLRPAQVVNDNVQSARHVFPESAIISRQPLRYNVQLNEQLTSVQQADDYLSSTENQLLRLRYMAVRGQTMSSAEQRSFQRQISRRTELSAGTIDRNFNVNLQKESQVTFTLPALNQTMRQETDETLIFSLAGQRSGRELAGVALNGESSTRQKLARLNKGLGRLGIHGQFDDQGQLKFTVAESQWSRVSQHFSVRGEGQSFPGDAFTSLTPVAESSAVDPLLQVAATGEMPKGGKLQSVLESISRQRQKLSGQQEKVSVRIGDMSANTSYSSEQVLALSQGIKEMLGQGSQKFSVLAQALSAQGNVHPSTVKNILG